MTKEEARKIALNRTPISSIIDIYDLGGCFEVTGRAGGDVLVYRIYSDGSICER